MGRVKKNGGSEWFMLQLCRCELWKRGSRETAADQAVLLCRCSAAGPAVVMTGVPLGPHLENLR